MGALSGPNGADTEGVPSDPQVTYGRAEPACSSQVLSTSGKISAHLALSRV